MRNEKQFLELVENAKNDPDVEKRRTLGFEKYGNLFNFSNIENIDIEKFRKFFNFKENRHWYGLTQNIALLVSNPKNLKASLKLLLDESKPISERIDEVMGSSGERKVKGYGLARISAILHYAHPDKYGAFNKVSLEALSKIDENPRENDPHWKSLTDGERYNLVNQKLLELSKKYKISLWAIDWVWWDMVRNSSDLGIEEDDETSEEENIEDENYLFKLESHLEEFIVENWETTLLYKELRLDILKDDETGQAIGEQYKMGNGKKIDILCKNKKTGGYTVIELKRGVTNTDVLGQIKMYIGWLKRNFAEGKPVDGIIIAHEFNEDLKYALTGESDIKLFTFKVGFELNNEGLDV